MKERARAAVVAVLLVLGTVGWMLAVEGRQGIGRDEAQYFRAGEHYWGWFDSAWQNLRAGHLRASFTRSGIDAYWSDNPEHPPVMKTLYGLSWRLFHRCDCMGPKRGLHPIAITGRHITLPLFARESTAFRFPAMLMAGLAAALVFWFARRLVGPIPAAVATVLTVAQPHYFFHAQIAAFDAPITTMALVVGFAYWKSLRSPRWGIACGFLYGIALGTKHNAWLMPAFLLGHYLWIRRGDLRARRLPRVPLAFIAMATIGPLTLLALWPHLWPDPLPRARAYMLRHLEHEHYNFEYLGRNWNLPPKDFDLKLLRTTFPFVSTLFTVPATTLVLAAAGGVALARRRRKDTEEAEVDDRLIASDPPTADRPTWLRPGADVDRAAGAFLAVQIAGPMMILALPSAPIFGGVKHFLPAMPYLAITAAIGLRWLTRTLRELLASPRARRVLPAALAVVVSLPAVVETQRSHPDGLSHYNFFAGGFAGGASLGMNRQFWGYSVLPMLPWMVRQPAHAIYWHDVLADALSMYARDGRIPLGMSNLGADESAIARSDLGIVIHEKHFTLFEGAFWREYGTTRPAYVRTREGVPLVTAYKRPGTP